MTKLTGKIAVVTGGTGALGQVVIKRLRNEGCVVISTHSGGDRSKNLIRQSQYSGIVFKKVDVTNSMEVGSFFLEVNNEFGGIDILCNLVGGVIGKKPVENISHSEWDLMLKMNLESVFNTMQHVIPIFKRNAYGRIINIAAVTGIHPEANKAAYSVSKAGVIALTKGVGEELKAIDSDITVNAIAPSIILTEANKQWGTVEEMKKWVTPEEIAEMIIFLASGKAKSINGQIIQMNGKV
ncbi:MAG: SDR family NAD(P)-dependent oxidoreductase [Bacteroidota bacterium]|jgi:gluconate 5-dehydrogenase